MSETSRMPAEASFAEVLCADPAWVATEFDAIIAANFDATPAPCPPVPPVRRRPGASGLRGHDHTAATAPLPQWHTEAVGASTGWSWPRSPPPSAPPA